MDHSSDFENLEAPKAARRERKRRLRMRQHGRSLKKITKRAVQHIHKVTKK